VNKFLHPPMQAIKQAARDGDSVRLEALCEAWSVSTETAAEGERPVEKAARAAVNLEPVKAERAKASEPVAEVRQ
jgi:hypothetical protein